MVFENVNPIEFHFVHYAVDEDQIFFRQGGVIVAPWSEHPWNDKGNGSFI